MSREKQVRQSVGEITSQLESELASALSVKDLEALKIKYLGKKGLIQDFMQELRHLSSEERPLMGKIINDLKQEVTSRLDKAVEYLESAELNKRLEGERVDVSLPGRRRSQGRRHVALRTLDESLEILVGMGFSVQYGPDVESDFYNFEALNFAKDHPARDMHDTFYVTHDTLLRTHTSNTQVRIMEANKPPIRVIMPGKCYRNEDVSSRSHVVFHQLEGLYIDKKVSFADLLKTLQEFFSKFFQKEIEIRFRPSYFPFVEPGMEVDIGCIVCEGKGCSVCKKTGWLEVAGAGMVHPEVLKAGGIDPEEYSGYAWGFGPERLTMLRYGINDIRLFFTDNLRFLNQF